MNQYMKTVARCAAAWLGACLAFCQVVAVPGPPVNLELGVPTVVESGPHHRVWQTLSVDPAGQTNVSTYTEVATGIDFLNPVSGKWESSKEQFHITPSGYAVATNGQTQLILAGNINAAGSVDCLTPDGLRLLSNPMGLSLFDVSSGKNLLIAEVTNSTGVLVATNVVLFDNCFDTIRGGLLFTYTREGYSQDVLLYERVELPDWMNPATTFLEMYSEFYAPPTPAKTSQRLY